MPPLATRQWSSSSRRTSTVACDNSYDRRTSREMVAPSGRQTVLTQSAAILWETVKKPVDIPKMSPRTNLQPTVASPLIFTWWNIMRAIKHDTIRILIDNIQRGDNKQTSTPNVQNTSTSTQIPHTISYSIVSHTMLCLTLIQCYAH